jgi:glycosyltransferase involved in cell wall biosynthesis
MISMAKTRTALVAALGALAVLYCGLGFYCLLGNASFSYPIDLRLRWSEEKLIVAGTDPTLAGHPEADLPDKHRGMTKFGGGYPPWGYATGLLLAPPLPWTATAWYFAVLCFVALAVIGRWAWGLGPEPGVRGNALVAVSVLAIFPIAICLSYGQYTLIASAFLVLCLILLERGNDAWAGVLLGAALIKPHLCGVFALVLLVRGRFRAAVFTALYLAAASGLVWWMTGSDPLSMLRRASEEATDSARAAIFSPQTTNPLAMLALPTFGPKLTTAILGGAGIVAAGVLLFISRRRGAPLLIDFAICAILTMFAGAYRKHYDCVLLLFPLAALILIWQRSRNRVAGLAALAFGATLWLPIRDSQWRLPLVAYGDLVVWLFGLLVILRSAGSGWHREPRGRCPGKSGDAGEPMTTRESIAIGLALFQAEVREYLAFDCRPVRPLAGALGLLVAWILGRVGRARQAFLLLCKLHRADYLNAANQRAEEAARRSAADHGNGPLPRLYADYIAQLGPTPTTARFFKDCRNLLGSLAIVVKSPADGEKGVIVVLYSHALPLFVKFFDIDRIAANYHIVIEPSWSGFCNLDVLSYSRFTFPVFVQASEPRDVEFIRRCRCNLVPVPVSNNWWVDQRVFRPLTDVSKDVDVVMVSSWAGWKRHRRLFAALRTLRRRGVTPTALLVGYAAGLSKRDVYRQAQFYGVSDQIEMLDNVSPDEVNQHLNRARVNLLWSRKEGSNRSIVEGMLAGVPCVIRHGFNYGYQYPYINPETGTFSSELELPDVLARMIATYDRFRPREWVLKNMSCQRATEILSQAIGETMAARGEPWSGQLAVKVNTLNGLRYWDPEDARRFEPDYEFLRSAVRLSQQPVTA